MIEIQHVTKCFGHTKALNNLTLAIPEGKVFGLLGTNGAGKSTLLRAIAGILKCDEGEIRIDGAVSYDAPEVKEKFFYLPDAPYYFPGATMAQMTEFYGRQYPAMDRDGVNYMADKLRLDVRCPLRTFSKGMKRQAFLIMALCANTDYLLCDEVFDGLDPVVTEAMKQFFCKEMKERKLTVVVAAHKLQDLEDFCEEIGILHRGGILLSGDMREKAGDIHKFQCVFDTDEEACEGQQSVGQGEAVRQTKEEELRRHLDIVKYREDGYCVTIIARGEESDILEVLCQRKPVFYKEVPMSLEEIFLAEMEAADYDIGKALQ